MHVCYTWVENGKLADIHLYVQLNRRDSINHADEPDTFALFKRTA